MPLIEAGVTVAAGAGTMNLYVVAESATLEGDKMAGVIHGTVQSRNLGIPLKVYNVQPYDQDNLIKVIRGEGRGVEDVTDSGDTPPVNVVVPTEILRAARDALRARQRRMDEADLEAARKAAVEAAVTQQTEGEETSALLATMEAMRRRIEELESAQAGRRGPGRPRKAAAVEGGEAAD